MPVYNADKSNDVPLMNNSAEINTINNQKLNELSERLPILVVSLQELLELDDYENSIKIIKTIDEVVNGADLTNLSKIDKQAITQKFSNNIFNRYAEQGSVMTMLFSALLNICKNQFPSHAICSMIRVINNILKLFSDSSEELYKAILNKSHSRKHPNGNSIYLLAQTIDDLAENGVHFSVFYNALDILKKIIGIFKENNLDLVLPLTEGKYRFFTAFRTLLKAANNSIDKLTLIETQEILKLLMVVIETSLETDPKKLAAALIQHETNLDYIYDYDFNSAWNYFCFAMEKILQNNFNYVLDFQGYFLEKFIKILLLLNHSISEMHLDRVAQPCMPFKDDIVTYIYLRLELSHPETIMQPSTLLGYIIDTHRNALDSRKTRSRKKIEDAIDFLKIPPRDCSIKANFFQLPPGLQFKEDSNNSPQEMVELQLLKKG